MSFHCRHSDITRGILLVSERTDFPYLNGIKRKHFPKLFGRLLIFQSNKDNEYTIERDNLRPRVDDFERGLMDYYFPKPSLIHVRDANAEEAGVHVILKEQGEKAEVNRILECDKKELCSPLNQNVGIIN